MSFGVLGTSALMAQIAGRGGRMLPSITFKTSADDPFIQSITCNGKLIVESIKDGQPLTEEYTDLDNITLYIHADADTDVVLRGYVKKCYFTAYDEEQEDYVGYTDVTGIDTSKCVCLKELSVDYCTIDMLDISANKNLTTLICGDISEESFTIQGLNQCTKLTYLYCAYSESITALDLAANTALQTLNCGGCTGLTALDLAANTALQSLYCYGCTGLIEIKYPATNSNVSTAIAGVITNATAADGTVYTDSAADYYSTIADAATAKGWTIEQLV